MITRKSFLVLAGVTAVLVIAAGATIVQQGPGAGIAVDGEKAFPELAAKLNDAKTFKVTSPEDTFTITREGDGWGIAEKGGYPVEFEKVKTAMVRLSELELLEPKTTDPERHSRLDVEEPDPKNEEGKSRRITIADEGGTVLADGVIGKQNFSLFGASGGGTYLRMGQDKQAWLARGDLSIGGTANDWLSRTIVNLEAEHVQRLSIRQADGAELVITNPSKDKPEFKVEGAPEGKVLRTESEPKDIAGGLWRLTLEDVQPAKEVEFPAPAERIISTYRKFDGLTVRVEIGKIGDDFWGLFSASVTEPPEDEKEAEAVKKAVEEINKRTSGWAYRLSIGESERLTSKKADLFKDPDAS